MQETQQKKGSPAHYNHAPFSDANNYFIAVFGKILAGTATDEEIEYAKLYAKDFAATSFEERFYNMLKQIFDQYSDEWSTHNEQAVADLLTEYQTRMIP